MSRTTIQILLLVTCLTSCVFLLREHKATPTGFLQRHMSRILETNQITKAFCDGVSQANDITVSEREAAKIHREFFSNRRNGNPLVAFIEGKELGGKIGTTYGQPIAKALIPFVIALAIAILGCLYYVLVWYCTHCCCCDIGLCSGPKPGGWRIPSFLIVLVFVTLLCGAAYFGIEHSKEFKQGGKKVLCSVGIFAEKLIDGSHDENWAGVQKSVENFQAMLDDWNPMVLKLTAAPSLVTTTQLSGISATVLAAKAAAQLMYATNTLKTVSPRPDPAKIPSYYQPTYIGNLSNVRDEILAEMSAKKAIVEASATTADIGINEIRVSSAAILLVLQKAQSTLKNVSETLAVVQKNLTLAGTQGNEAISTASSGLFGVFVTNIVVGAFAGLSTIVGLFGAGWASKGLHLSWCTIMLISISCWILSTVLYPVSLVLTEGCEVGNKLLDNSTFFNVTMDKFVVYNMTTGEKTENGEDVKGILYRCYWGDGNLIDQLNLTNIFGIFENVFQPLDNIANLSTSIGPVPDSYVIPAQQKIIKDIKWGLVADSSESATDLTLLNSLTNSKTDSCTQLQDTWGLNSTKCEASAGTKFALTDSETSSINSPTCIGFDAWNHKQINKRYNPTAFPQPSCGLKNLLPMSTYLQKFVDNFADSRDSVNSVFTGLESDLGNVATANGLYMGSVKVATTAFDPVRTATAITRKAMWDPTTGFIKNSNCTFFRTATKDLLDSVCVRFGNSLFSTMVSSTATSLFGTLSGVAIFLLVFKFFSKKVAEGKADGLLDD